MLLQPKSGRDSLLAEGSRPLTYTHLVELLFTRDQRVPDTANYSMHNKHNDAMTNIHILSGFRTRDPSNQAAADYVLAHTATPISLSVYICIYIIPYLGLYFKIFQKIYLYNLFL